MRKLLSILILAMGTLTKSAFCIAAEPKRPRLIIGIVVDQMRYDFLYRYQKFYTKNGFNRLLDKGVNFTQTRYSYAPTVTGPGHASIYTGSVPSIHGIAGNNWLELNGWKKTYCTDDSTVTSVGGSAEAGRMSPRNMVTTTLGDQLKIATNFTSKVIGIALKDRGAILPAGHSANAAYWFDSPTGNWISSTYYLQQLPAWANSFNQAQKPLAYLKGGWSTLVPQADLAPVSGPDDSPFEASITKKASPTFPYDLMQGFDGNYELLRRTPFGNSLTTDFALASLEGEALGMGTSTDMLCLSYSSTDYVGHACGPQSVEVADTYIRLDREIERLITAAEKKVGKGNLLVFLSADHGIIENPGIANSHKLPGGRFDMKKLCKELNETLEKEYGPGTYIRGHLDEQIYLDEAELAAEKSDIQQAFLKLRPILLRQDFIINAYLAPNLQAQSSPITARLAAGYYPRRSGQLLLQIKPGYIDGTGTKGTTHSAPYEYDTHVPFLLYGFGLKPRTIHSPTQVADIAATIADLLNLMAPSGCIGISQVDKLE